MASQLNQKERMLLQDQQHHEELCIQKYTKYANEAQDSQLKQLFQIHASHEQNHYDTIGQILRGQVPNINQQQGQQNQSFQAQNSGTQSQNTSFNQNDASLANDMLTTEKYISGTYDTTIFEIRDTQIRQVLNHIQKEEQQHGEDLYNYMQSHGMYNTPS